MPWKKKTIISVCLVLLLLLLSSVVYNYFFVKKNELSDPEYILNRFVWLTTTRIEDSLKVLYEEKKTDFANIHQLLTLYGAMNENMTAVIGEKEYPKMFNGYTVNDYFLALSEKREIENEDWVIIEKLYDLYKELDLTQSLLMSEEGKIDAKMMTKLIELDHQIISLVHRG